MSAEAIPYRKVAVGTWGDARFAALSEDAKLLWFYLLTGPEVTNLPGLIVAGRAHLTEAMGWDLMRFDRAFGELAAPDADGLPMAQADWRARVVWIPKAHLYNRPQNPNVVASWSKSFRTIPETASKGRHFRALKSLCDSMGDGFSKAFSKTFADMESVDQEPRSMVDPKTPPDRPASDPVSVSDPDSDARLPARDGAVPTPAESRSGVHAVVPEPAPRGPLPASELELHGVAWVEAYERAAQRALADPGWTFNALDRRLLLQLVSTRCPDRARAAQWFTSIVPKFIAAVRPKLGVYSSGQPRGLLKWFNDQRPEIAAAVPIASNAAIAGSVASRPVREAPIPGKTQP